MTAIRQRPEGILRPDRLSMYRAPYDRIDAAKEVLDAVTQAFPGHFWPWLKLALMAQEEGDIDSARTRLGQAIARDQEEQQPKLRLMQGKRPVCLH